MKPLTKEAQELVEKFTNLFVYHIPLDAEINKQLLAKRCAIIHCDLMIKELKEAEDITDSNKTFNHCMYRIQHYTDLKKEIENL